MTKHFFIRSGVLEQFEGAMPERKIFHKPVKSCHPCMDLLTCSSLFNIVLNRVKNYLHLEPGEQEYMFSFLPWQENICMDFPDHSLIQ